MSSSLIPDLNFVFPYSVLLLNCLLFRTLRVIVFPLTPNSVRTVISELISTLELCSDCAELGVVWEIHGNIGYGLALLLLCIWWTQVFEDAEACPCGPIEDCLLLGQPFTSSHTIQRLLGQILGAFITAKYTTYIWCWHLTPQHLSLHTNRCEASLQVSVLYGMAVEGFITFISRIISLESINWSQKVSLYVNSLTTVSLVLFALNTTGGYFNPIMASALTLNCKGNTLFEHLLVYWIGSLIGGLIARYLHIFILKLDLKQKIN